MGSGKEQEARVPGLPWDAWPMLFPGWYRVLGADGCRWVHGQRVGGLEIRVLAKQTAAYWAAFLWAW